MRAPHRRWLAALAAAWLGCAAGRGAPHTVRVGGRTTTVSAHRPAPRGEAPPVRYHGYGSDGPERPWVGRHDPSYRPDTGGPSHSHGPPAAWNLGLGSFLAGDREGLDAGRVEYRSGQRVLGAARWLAGVTLGPDDFVLPYAGLFWDLPLGERWVFTPAGALGPLSGGDDTRFGGTLQFRTSLELAYRLDARQRVGVAVQHVSNAELEQPNKGANTQLVTYTVALGR